MKCLKFALTDYGRTNKAKIPDTRYEFALSISMKPMKSNKHISIHINSQLFEKKTEQHKLGLAAIQISSSFFVQNFDDHISKDRKGDLNIPEALIQLCSSIIVGALRGMLVLKLEKTLYANALLPLIDTDLVRTITTVNEPS